jgi:hypothetical protein
MGLFLGTWFEPSFIGILRGANKAGMPAVQMSSSSLDSLPSDAVEELASSCKSPIVSPLVVTGRSGVRHSFTLGVKDSVSVVMACDTVVGSAPSDETKVLALFIKVYDVNVKHVILCAIPSLTAEAKKLAAQYKMVVLEALDKKTVLAKLSDYLRTLPKD